MKFYINTKERSRQLQEKLNQEEDKITDLEQLQGSIVPLMQHRSLMA
jgi:hypothetical protein